MSKVVESLSKLRDLPADELVTALARCRDELFRLKLGMQTNQVASTASVGTKRKEIARILTILRGRTLGTDVQGQAKGRAAAAKPAKTAAQAPKESKKAPRAKAPKAAK